MKAVYAMAVFTAPCRRPTLSIRSGDQVMAMATATGSRTSGGRLDVWATFDGEPRVELRPRRALPSLRVYVADLTGAGR
jgi:hypothetical protein